MYVVHTNGKPLYSIGSSAPCCDDLDGWEGRGEREAQEGGDICIHIADLLHPTAEINTTL